MKLFLFVIASLVINLVSNSQATYPFKITLEPVIPSGFKGLQSYAWAKNGDKVLLIGGRTDGLHRRQPFASFNKKYNNTEFIVVDLQQEKVWTKDMSGLPKAVAEQLKSTNMQFYQQENQLVITGGYGYSETKGDHITHPALIHIRVKELIEAIISNSDIMPFISQLADERMAVTGGRLNKFGDQFFLVGGQRFEGRYNPHGPDHGPGFFQQYTNQIRKFKLIENGGNIRIENYSDITDSLLLHRRDYNLLSQVDADGKAMLTIYSGVFQYAKNVPFTNLVDITESGYKEVAGFNQRFSHYHSATLPAYNRKSKTLYTIFFGGIAQNYIDSLGKVITDNDVPFVKHISVVERKENAVTEYILPDPMPGYFGAAAEFIPADEKHYTTTGILNLDKAGKKTILAGYIIGGIDSRDKNIFWSNEAEPSRASPVIWKVYLTVQ